MSDDLTAPSGERIPAGVADLAPALLQLEPGASASALLHVAIPLDSAPGVYHGHVLSAALPTSALAVRLEVEP